MNRQSYVHQISEISPIERVRLRASASTVASERRCVGVDRRCRESEGKAKIEGYMSVSDEEAHQQILKRVVLFSDQVTCLFFMWTMYLTASGRRNKGRPELIRMV